MAVHHSCAHSVMNNVNIEHLYIIDRHCFYVTKYGILLPTGSEEREVLGVGSISVAILPCCQYMKNIAL